ncbi:DUF11 domain-containing protein [Streptomyces sp. MUM 203J]|uniref:DUF11 domain-containing protein n=1 Tax=Streptomyces sp. MUM 203J TaxID=2791990 RepID=UPI001F0469FF|nr:DUF11 domain-containing protein [Streptomyces sp. MUM 203J]MCH0538167.1 DUF11 domain-containing protein [Streptomyces sp. MUM 203J]
MASGLKAARDGAADAGVRRRAAHTLPGVLVGVVLAGATALPASATLAPPLEGRGSGCPHEAPVPTSRQEAPDDCPDGGTEARTGEPRAEERETREEPREEEEQGGAEGPRGTAGADRPQRFPGRADLAALSPVLPRDVAPGETYDYRITVVNHGPAQARNATAADELPPALSFVGSKDGCTAEGRRVTCGPVVTLDPGETASWTITVRLDPAYTGDGSDILNQATVSSDTGDPDPANNTGPHPGAGPPHGKVQPPRADLAVTKEFTDPDPVAPGAVLAYVLTARNHGPSQAVGVSVTDRLPEGLAFVDSPDGCTGEPGAYGGTVTCPETAVLGPGRRAVFTVRARLHPGYTGDGSDLVNRARTGARTGDPDQSNNTTELTGLPGDGGGPAPASADLVLAKRYELPDGADAATPGETYAYVMTVRNEGPSTARDVTVTDPLPRALSYAGSSDGCSAEGATVTCGGSGSLAPGQTAEYRFTVRLARDFDGDCAAVDNTARASSAVHDPDTGNNAATVGKTTPGETGDCGVPVRPRPGPSPSPTHHDHDHDHDHTLPDTGSGVPGWLPWTAGLALAAGSGLVVLVRRRRA